MWIGILIGFLGFIFGGALGSDVDFGSRACSESVAQSFGGTTTVLRTADEVEVGEVEGVEGVGGSINGRL